MISYYQSTSHLSSKQRVSLFVLGEAGLYKLVGGLDPVGAGGPRGSDSLVVQELEGFLVDVLNGHEFLMEDDLLVDVRGLYGD